MKNLKLLALTMTVIMIFTICALGCSSSDNGGTTPSHMEEPTTEEPTTEQTISYTEIYSSSATFMVPEGPVLLYDYSYYASTSYFEITITSFDSSNCVYYDVNMISNPKDNDLVGFKYKVIDSEGNIIDTGSEYLPELSTGEKAIDQYFYISGSYSYDETYTIELYDKR